MVAEFTCTLFILLFDSCISSCVRYVEYYAAEAGRRLQVFVQVPYVIIYKGII